MAFKSELLIEFLRSVPFLQRLPDSSLAKISRLCSFERYNEGDYVIHKGETVGGTYFILEGEAVVTKPFHADEENQPKFLLKKYDCFGQASSIQAADVISLSKLTCLVLPSKYVNLLKPHSIWNADELEDKRPIVERILDLDPIEVNIFQGLTLPDAPQFERVFGGQFLGQALAAACKTVDSHKNAHSLHAYFLRVGDVHIPIIYRVHRVHEGRNFATRKVDAIQKGNIIFIMTASFQKEEEGFDHQVARMPSVPDPDELLPMGEQLAVRFADPGHMTYAEKEAGATLVPRTTEIRLCDPNAFTNETKFPPSLMYWFRTKGKLSDDQGLHSCAAAFSSDLIFLQVSRYPHHEDGLKIFCISQDHSMWFHRPFRADDWLLYVIDSPIAHRGRGFVSGQIFNRKGELVISVTQHGLLRVDKMSSAATQSKM